MKFKNNVLEKLNQLDATVNKVKFQVNRGMDQDQILESLDQVKEQIEKINEIISLEQDDFAQQFAQ
jgi:tetrahydromethanopterin S-methyltransferase subunit B